MPLYDFQCHAGHEFERHVKLADFDEVQSCQCGADARRLVSAPRIQTDSIEPARGADGKMHTSLASLRHSYTPSGNPQGERYYEVGNDIPKGKKASFDRKQRREDIRAAISDVKNGRVPPIPPGPPA